MALDATSRDRENFGQKVWDGARCYWEHSENLRNIIGNIWEHKTKNSILTPLPKGKKIFFGVCSIISLVTCILYFKHGPP